MKLLVDAHLHLHPCFDLDRALAVLMDRLLAEDAQSVHAACLTERSGSCLGRQLLSGCTALRTFCIEDGGKGRMVLCRKSDGRQLTLLPGRQIVSAEKIEVLALCTEAMFPDGAAAADLIRSIREQNGIPVLPWSPGKWFFQRGRVVDGLLRSFGPEDFLIGDVGLRPWVWPMPLLMRKALRLGYRLISGSDPLPFGGEEEQCGRYGSRIVSSQEEGLLPDEALHGLLAGQAAVASFGRRSGPLEFLQRLRYNAAVRRQGTRPEAAFTNDMTSSGR